MARVARGRVSRRKFLVNMAGVSAGLTLSLGGNTIGSRAAQGATVRNTARDRLEEALARIADPNGEGARTVLTVYAIAARAAADASDARARTGKMLGPLDGAIVTIKDLFDVAGEATRAGSKILVGAAPAKTDAAAVRRLRSAGVVVVGKTNMSEFALTGIGANPHYGTPRNPADRSRVPGGSSSGAAVAVADGFCEIAIGSDTGGSTRIPASFCGITGFKPSKSRVPTDGAFPFSPALDSVGPMAKTVAQCAAADAVMAGEPPWIVEPETLSGLRLGIPSGPPLTGLDETVSSRFAEARSALLRAGVNVTEEEMPLFADMARVNSKAAIGMVEAYAVHRDWLTMRASDYDPNVTARLIAAGVVTASEHGAQLEERARLVRAMDARLANLDALVLPTTPIVAPTIAEVTDPGAFATKNLASLRNCQFVNFFDLCAISIPCAHRAGLPVGLQLVARNGSDKRLFRIAAAVEKLFTA